MARKAKPQAAVYEIRHRLDAPLEFVYAWATDYTPQDAKLEKEDYLRRIIARSERTVDYQDLMDAGRRGWTWAHHHVTLAPPNAWHSDSIGSHRSWSLDYTLRALPDGATELTLRGTRIPTAIGAPKVARAVMEKELHKTWANFNRVLVKDYRASRKATGRR